MKDSVCVVTGANAGLGKATASALAHLGATVILVCRDRVRGAAALAEVKTASGNTTLELAIADLDSLSSVRAMADELCRTHERVDVLVNNAAIYKSQRIVTADGLETMFATNYLGHFLLTNLLLDRLKAAPAARIIHVTAPVTTKLPFDDLQSTRKFSASTAFGISKMCNLVFSYALARHLAGTSITSNALHPGVMKSKIMNEASWMIQFISNLIAHSPEKAAEAVVFLATSPEVAGVTGQFFKGKKQGDASPFAKDPQVQDRLWHLSAQLAQLPSSG